VGRNLSYQSMERLGATLMTSIRLSNSVFTLLLGYVLLHELPRPWQLAGLVLVTVGLWLSLRPARRLDVRLPRIINPAGVVMAVASAAAFAFGDTARRLGLKITPAPVFGAAIGASTALLAHLAWGVFRHSARWPSGQVLRRLDLIASAVFNTMAILLLYMGLQRAPVATVSVLYNLQVLVVLLLSPVILRGQETLTGWLIAGTCVALAGTVLILLG
jgi:drug/metabolite transporter (DMT)-like permease